MTWRFATDSTPEDFAEMRTACRRARWVSHGPLIRGMQYIQQANTMKSPFSRMERLHYARCEFLRGIRMATERGEDALETLGREVLGHLQKDLQEAVPILLDEWQESHLHKLRAAKTRQKQYKLAWEVEVKAGYFPHWWKDFPELLPKASTVHQYWQDQLALCKQLQAETG